MSTSSPSPAPEPDLLVLGAIALGGGVGSALRYALAQAVHRNAGGFGVATLVTNLVGSLLLGALIVAVTEIWRPHRLLRPLLGTGLLGGFTTFSTFAIEARGMGADVAAAYIVASVLGGVCAAALGMRMVRLLTPPRWRTPDHHSDVDLLDPDLP
ncbi:MAG: CrcB family protein [Actinomycetota bacterium]|nr:CrcB family protein [Actinomycetota bacterium]